MLRVTEILSPWSDFSMIRPDVLKRAADRGTRAHNFCAAYATGVFIPGKVDEDCQGYLDSFKRWFDLLVDEVLFCEVEMKDSTFGFMGHPDLGLTLKDGRRVIPDIKTPITKQKTWPVQCSAYRHMANLPENGAHKIEQIASLRVCPKGGTAKMDFYDNPNELFGIFLGSLNAYKYFKEV